MSAYFRVEFRRLFQERRNGYALVLLIILSLYFTYTGIVEYRRCLAERSVFERMEKEKVDQYANYLQYGSIGFRIFFQAVPAIVFFHNSNVLQDVESNIDMSETLRINQPFKGKSLFANRGYFKDFSGILLLFGTLFFLYNGGRSFISRAYLRFFLARVPRHRHFLLTVTARLAWLNLATCLLAALCFLLARSSGIHFSGQEIWLLLGYFLYLLLFLDFFFFLGLAVAVIVRFRRIYFPLLLIVWFTGVFLIPEINRVNLFAKSAYLQSAEKINYEKLKMLMSMERSFKEYLQKNPTATLERLREVQKQFSANFLQTGYLLNSGLEKRYLGEVAQIIRRYELQSLVFPATFFTFLSSEVSGKGYYAYLAFHEYVIKLRDRFVQFFLGKRFAPTPNQVESFVKSDENIFLTSSSLPHTFAAGFFLVVVYSVLLAVFSWLRLSKTVFGL